MSDIPQDLERDVDEQLDALEALEDDTDTIDTTPNTSPLDEQAKTILDENYRGSYTVPAENLYPHQWLWDSCFIAIGLRHCDIDRAKTELRSLVRGQWANGMLPNMIFSDLPQYQNDRNYWRSWVSPDSPDGLATSGITQPPMLAEAVWQIGQKLPAPERRAWFKSMLPHIQAYHEWLYTERDPHNEGLVLLVHPWETGLDNTPPWMYELHEHSMPSWIRLVQTTHLDKIIGLFRRDSHYIPPGQRFSTIEILSLFDAQRRLRRKKYQTAKILDRGLFSIEDLSFNCIFIRANEHLRAIAKAVRHTLPGELLDNMKRTEKALDSLWDPYANTHWSRVFITHTLLKQSSIATFLPLYAGSISKDKAEKIVQHLENETKFGAPFAVPSVPLDSAQFDENRYWQGPTWVNTNWLIIDGLRRYGYNDHADALTESTLDMVAKSGFYEYFNPLTAEPLGARNFSWTAALVLDLLQTSE
ncbi:MAG: hypothetical protein QG629_761 [Patescibacteria group bacterium]|nr:glycoside hydrolase [Candidatus Saccharibacteria bacterium]MDQ5963678.1 hypothetical protein [Patescibacteria group bacterium]